jgi:TatD DNase family protein
MTPLFDSHAHYDDPRFDGDRDAVLGGLASAGVGYVANIGSDVASSRASIALAERYDFIVAAVGVHPHAAITLDDAALAEIEAMLRHPKARALGEIGLDYHYDFSPRETQRAAFAAQLELAARLSIPVVIHEREATADCLAMLRDFPRVTGVFHCFGGSVETAGQLVEAGWMISLAGPVTFKNARKSREVAAFVPPDRLMIETDAPYLAPEPCRGRRNDSTLLRHTLAAVAAARGMDLDACAALTTGNARRFYGI